MTLARAIRDRTPQLATIVGPPGIGKSRLARELVQRADAQVFVGRCLSYGEGITYWPLAEVAAQLGDVRSALEGEASVAEPRALSRDPRLASSSSRDYDSAMKTCCALFGAHVQSEVDYPFNGCEVRRAG
jgi:predicted ATPase